tara:strand:+ start:1056 stop:2072 length:1017 start_codon:yes stop_codon:yes gene_type:complete
VRRLQDIETPALAVDLASFHYNMETMTAERPGSSLRPHVKAFKSTAIASVLEENGHSSFCCATIREIEGMIEAGHKSDLLLANETLDASRLGSLVESGARVTVAVDSEATVKVAAEAGIKEVLIDVNVGLPRCGCSLSEVEDLATLAKRHRLGIRGVMGYEGHLMFTADKQERSMEVNKAMEILSQAHSIVGGDVISAGGTGTFDINKFATEIQAGSYLFMDTRYAQIELPFRECLSVVSNVISIEHDRKWAVTNAGVKAIGMDYGKPKVEGSIVALCSDEHSTLFPLEGNEKTALEIGDVVMMKPSHVDPTIAKHPRILCMDGEYIIDEWPIDLRDW